MQLFLEMNPSYNPTILSLNQIVHLEEYLADSGLWLCPPASGSAIAQPWLDRNEATTSERSV